MQYCLSIPLATTATRINHLRRSAAICLCALTLAGCGGGGNTADTPPASSADDVQATALTLDDVQARVVAWYPIAHSADDPDNRNVGRSIPEYGWAPFVNYVVLPEITSRGLNRVQLHNPFGRRQDPASPMFAPADAFQFDQYLEATAAGLDGLTADFVSAWTPVTNMGVQVIAYIGSPLLDPDSQVLLDAGDTSGFTERAQQALDPILQAGMSIGFDAATVAQQDSATFALAESLRTQGTPIYVEAGPRMDHPWWFDYPVISRDDTWRERLDNPDFAPRAALAGEVLRIAIVDPDFPDTHDSDVWPPQVCRILAEGDSVLVEDFILRDPNRKLSSLVDCANALLQQDNS